MSSIVLDEGLIDLALATSESRHCGRLAPRSTSWLVTIQPRTPTTTKVTATTEITDTTRGNFQRSRRLASGVSKKLKKTASATGTRISLAKCRAATTSTSAASVSSGD